MPAVWRIVQCQMQSNFRNSLADLPRAAARSTIQVLQQPATHVPLQHAIFDFDGTLSWLRHGWPEMMANVMKRQWQPLPGECDGYRDRKLDGIVIGMNGQPSIRQMSAFCELIRSRDGRVLDPEKLRQEFQDELDTQIAARLQRIRLGTAERERYVIHGARALLVQLRAEGVKLSIVSTTVQSRVRDEAAQLGLDEFFDGRIWGSGRDPLGFSKRDVFARILAEEQVQSGGFIAFGDGPAEIQATRELGGIAVGVCSSESDNGSGIPDPDKQRLLAAAGAHFLIPDYRDAATILNQLTHNAIA